MVATGSGRARKKASLGLKTLVSTLKYYHLNMGIHHIPLKLPKPISLGFKIG